MSQTNRLHFIDIAKGIAIILVIFAHTFRGNALKTFIYAFHIPVFFIISGVFFNPNKYTGFKSFLKLKFKSLLIPYIFFYSLSFFYWLIVERYIRPGANVPISTPLLGLFYGTDTASYMVPNGALWFLTGLFTAELILFIILKHSKKIFFRILWICLIGIGGYALSLYDVLRLPLSFNSSLIAVVFLGFGYFIKDYIKQRSIHKITILCAALVLFVAVYFLSKLNGIIDMDYTNYNNIFLFLASAILGSIALLLFSKLLNKQPILEYLGKFSIVLMGLSEPIKRAFIGLFSKLSAIPVSEIRMSIVYSSIVTLLVVISLVPAIFILDKYFNFLIGKKKTV